MIFEERKQSSHAANESYCHVRYISADFITDRKTQRKLTEHYPNYMDTWGMCGMLGDCLYIDEHLYLVVKERYYQSPTYASVKEALECLKQTCDKYRITKIAIPKISCVSDRLLWFRIREMMFRIFEDSSIYVLIYEG